MLVETITRKLKKNIVPRAYKRARFVANREYSRWIARGLLDDVNQKPVPESDLIFLFSPHRDEVREPFYTLLARELYERGIQCYFLAKGPLYDYFKPRLKVDGKQVSNTLSVSGFPCVFQSSLFKPRAFKHEKDLENETYLIDDINFFPIIKSSLTSANKRLNFHFSNPKILKQVESLADSCDVLLNYFYLLQSYAQSNKKTFRIMITQFIDLPNSVFKFLSDHFNSQEIQCLTALPGMGMYYFRGDRRYWNYIVSNLNQRKLDFGVEVSKEQLSLVKKDSDEISGLTKSIEKAIRRNVEQTHTAEELAQRDEISKLVEDYKKRGKSVYVLFGQLFYDLAVFDTSPVFNDLCEWIKKTIQYFKDKDALLLLKPHVAELSRAPNETLESFTKEFCHITDNVKLLHANSFSLNEVAKFMDCGLIWTSSVGMELTYLGIPGIIAGRPVYRALDLEYANSTDDYFNKIENWKDIKQTEEQKRQVACYTYYLENMQTVFVPHLQMLLSHIQNSHLL